MNLLNHPSDPNTQVTATGQTVPRGLNLNSPIVQDMIRRDPEKYAKWPPDMFYYGPTPTVTEETVAIPSSSLHPFQDYHPEFDFTKFAPEEINPNASPMDKIRHDMMTGRVSPSQRPGYVDPRNYDPTKTIQDTRDPFTMATIIANNGQIPSYQFNGALSQPQYFDSSQPVNPCAMYPSQQMNMTPAQMAMGRMGVGYQQPPMQYQAPLMHSMMNPPQNYNDRMSGIGMRLPYGVMPVPGMLYDAVSPYCYSGVQPNEFNPLPDYTHIQETRQGGVPFKGVYLPPSQADEMKARHNYAMAFGYKSVEDLERCNFEMQKSLSVVANKILGKTDDEIKATLKRCYDEPVERMKKQQSRPAYMQSPYLYAPDGRWIGWGSGFEEPGRKHKPLFNVRLKKGDTILAESTIEEQKHKTYQGDGITAGEIIAGIKRSQQIRMTMDQIIAVNHANALERQFDRCDIIQFFNDAFYPLEWRDRDRAYQQAKSQRFIKQFDPVAFKEQLIANAGENYYRVGLRNEVMRERARYYKDEKYPINILQGGYGTMPGGIPMSPEADPNMGYCFTFDLESGQMEPKLPRSDKELDKLRLPFLATIGGSEYI